MTMALQPGTLAPDFELTYRDPRATVSLKEHLGTGPVVLLFYPLAFSSTCTEQLCSVEEDYSAYEEIGATVLAISVDSPYTNARFADACGASFPFLSDFNRTASRDYGVLRESLGRLEGVSERAAFVIDRDGVITYSWVGEHPGVFPPLGEIVAAARAARGAAQVQSIERPRT